MDIAIAHEWLAQRAGSEKTFLALAGLFPDADLYALTNELGDALGDQRAVRTTFVSDVGLLRQHRSFALPLMPLAWRMLRARPYDVVITSSHACVKGFYPARAALQLCYCHAPMRYVWDEHDDRGRLHRAGRYGPVPALRQWDRRSVRWVDSFAANSTAVQERIARYYDRSSRVIPPPVDTDFYCPAPPAGEDEDDRADLPSGPFLLACSRYIPYKRLDLAILAADRVGLPIVLAGGGPGEAELRALAETVDVPVRFERAPSDRRLRALYRGAAAFVFPALEDFGIVAVEAQACGTPVVALAAGGALDSVVDGVTGALAAAQDVDEFAAAIGRVVDGDLDPAACVAHAAGFSHAAFGRAVNRWVEESWAPGSGPAGTAGR